MTTQEKIEEVLRNRILFIGEDIPDFSVRKDECKSVYIGYPMQIIKELCKVVSLIKREGFDTGYKKGRKDLIKELEKEVYKIKRSYEGLYPDAPTVSESLLEVSLILHKLFK